MSIAQDISHIMLKTWNFSINSNPTSTPKHHKKRSVPVNHAQSFVFTLRNQLCTIIHVTIYIIFSSRFNLRNVSINKFNKALKDGITCLNVISGFIVNPFCALLKARHDPRQWYLHNGDSYSIIWIEYVFWIDTFAMFKCLHPRWCYIV